MSSEPRIVTFGQQRDGAGPTGMGGAVGGGNDGTGGGGVVVVGGGGRVVPSMKVECQWFKHIIFKLTTAHTTGIRDIRNVAKTFRKCHAYNPAAPIFGCNFHFLKFSFLLTIGKHFALELFVTTAPLEQSKEKSQVILSLPEFRVARKGHFALFA